MLSTNKLLIPLTSSLVIITYFLSLTSPGLGAYFGPDDMMNLDDASSTTWASIVAANMKCGTASYRPMGAALYKALYDLFGFDPRPFRYVSFTLLFFNLWLCYRLTSRLDTRFTGLLAALLAAFHGGLDDLYYSSGTVYDLLCAFFYLSSFAYYVGLRAGAKVLTGTRSVILVALYMCALSSKEIAVTLPAAIMLYEWHYHLNDWRSFKPVWLLRPGGIAGIWASTLTLIYIYAKTSPNSVFSKLMRIGLPIR